MDRIAVFPGSFDPITRGHESVIRRAMPLFDRIIVAIGDNALKDGFFPVEQRRKWLEIMFRHDDTVDVATYKGLTVEYCRQNGIRYILRGLRTSADFEFERGIGQMNKLMVPDTETVFLLCAPEYASLSSSIVRDIIRNGGDVRQFVPEAIYEDLKIRK